LLAQALALDLAIEHGATHEFGRVTGGVAHLHPAGGFDHDGEMATFEQDDAIGHILLEGSVKAFAAGRTEPRVKLH
jgi:hypothetical protein